MRTVPAPIITPGVRRFSAVLAIVAAGAFGQSTQRAPAADTPEQTPASQQPAQDQKQQDESDRTLDIPAQSPKVAVEQPPGALKTLIINVAKDQKVMWTSPFHMTSHNAPIWIGFAAATGVLVATDRSTYRQLPNTTDQVNFANNFSQIGEVYTLYPLMGAWYLAGVLTDSPKAKEVGALGAESLTDALILSSIIKVVTGRERPNLPNGNGRFGEWGNYSFPSGHSIMGFALASLVAHEYHNTKWVPIVAYSLATAVSAARFAGRDHWASDIVAGGGMGFFIGRYVYRRHVDPAIHHAPISRLMPTGVVPYVNSNTASMGMGVSWQLGTR